MSKPTSAVKDRWNKVNYDQLNIRLPKGKKAELQKAAEAAGMSLNQYCASKLLKDIILCDISSKESQ